MRTLTGIELGADSCVMVRVRSSRGTSRVSAVHGLYEEDWNPGRTLSENLLGARRSLGFPRRARVVAWGLAGGGADDLANRAAVAPLTEAGFIVDAVVSPAEALAHLAQQRSGAAGRNGAAWLSLNRHGAAIAIVHGRELLYSREFDWHYRATMTVKAELLQRYSLVAHVAPELRHGLDVVRAERGIAIDAVVTCGDLPDLRSLTMPLIEELDIEVETLDTLDGLTVISPARVEAIADRAPAIRLACAVTTIKATAQQTMRQPWLAAAAALVLLVPIVWAARHYRGVGAAGDSASTQPAPRTEVRQETRAPDSSASGVQKPPAASAGPGSAQSTSGVGRGVASDPPQPQGANVPAATTGSRTALQSTGAATQSAQARNEATADRPPAERTRTESVPGPRRAEVESVQRRAADNTARAPVPLKDPLPVVNSILVSPDRRLAVVDGEIVREGEHLGRRLLIRIESTALVLREPSGYEVRVPIRRKFGPDRESDIQLETDTLGERRREIEG